MVYNPSMAKSVGGEEMDVPHSATAPRGRHPTGKARGGDAARVGAPPPAGSEEPGLVGGRLPQVGLNYRRPTSGGDLVIVENGVEVRGDPCEENVDRTVGVTDTKQVS